MQALMVIKIKAKLYMKRNKFQNEKFDFTVPVSCLAFLIKRRN